MFVVFKKRNEREGEGERQKGRVLRLMLVHAQCLRESTVGRSDVFMSLCFKCAF